MHRPPPLPALTSLRFILAAGVLGSHIVAWSGAPGWLLTMTVPLGSSLVPIFFCLSGFVLTYSYAISPASPLAFLRARAAHILPAYWLGLLVGTALGFGRLSQGWPSWVLTLLMFHAWLPYEAVHLWNSPSWSLSCEVAFYLLFPVLLLLIKRLTPRTSIVASVSAVIVLTVVTAQIMPAYWWWHPLAGIGPFLLGMALGQAYLAGQRLPAHAGLAVIAAWPLTIAAWPRPQTIAA